MANSALWQLICVQILFAELMYFAVSDTDQDSKNVPIKIIRGTFESYLNCTDKDGIIWKRDNKITKPKNKTNLPPYLFPIFCARKGDEGEYTCHANKSGPALRRIHVAVTKKKRIHACGRPYGDLSVSKRKQVVCASFYAEDYPCCKIMPVAAKTMKLDLQDSLGNSKTKCSDIYINGTIKTTPYTVTVSWKINPHGSHGTWGWKIMVLGLNGNPGYRQCHLVITKRKKEVVRKTEDEELNTTIRNLMLGAKYNITIQTLPESRKKPNAIYWFIEIPHLLDMCETSKGRNCNWEFCFPVKDVKVTNYSTSPTVSWRSSPFYKSRHMFEVVYHDEENTDKNKIIVESGTSSNLTKLQYKYGRKYFVTVRPIFLHPTIEFGNSPRGKYSNVVIFYTADLPTVPTPRPSHNLKIIISVSVVTVCLFIVFLWILHRRCTPGENGISDSRETLIKPNSDVLLVHDGHCESCNHATHLLANILWETGHIRCFLDLCSTKEIAINGLQWYEDKLKTCGKIVVICTKESKSTYYNRDYNGHGENSNFYQNSFRMVLKMILGEMANRDGSNNATQIFPVCFDYSSSDDIPNFLRDKQYFSLPLEIEDLLLSLSDLNARPIGVMAEFGFQNNKLDKMINQWKDAIRTVEKKHYKNGSGLLLNYARSLSCTSSNEAARV